MPQTAKSREDEVREVLINAIEVQLAAMKAGIGFWRDWIEKTSDFVKTASEQLQTIRSEDREAKQVLLEIVDAGRESMRSLTELPRDAATRFIEELDEVDKKRGRPATPKPRAETKRTRTAATRKKAARRPSRPKRKARAKD